MEPMRPTMEQIDRRLFRTLVGKISDVKKYRIWKLQVMASFPIRNKVREPA